MNRYNSVHENYPPFLSQPSPYRTGFGGQASGPIASAIALATAGKRTGNNFCISTHFSKMTSLLLIAIFFSVTSLHPRASDMRVCSFTGNSGIAQFCNANITQALCVAGSGNIFFGNTARVDQEYGDDTKASVGGSPFLTISAALAAVAPGNVVWIGPGTYDETINIPAGVIVTGISHAAVIIRAMNVTQSTDLVTMGEGAVLQQATLEMSSAADVQLRAIVHPGSIPQVGITVYNVNITIDATFAGAGTTPIYGIHFTGNADLTSADVVFGGVTSITVAGTGRKVRWVYVDSPALVEITSSIGQVFGGNNSIGLEVNNPAANLAVGAGAAGGDTADISRIAGLLQITAIYLVHSTANGLGFTNLLFPQTFTWAEPDTPIGPPGIFYLRPGTGQATGFPVLLHLFQKGVAYAMSVHAITPPGIGESSTFILQINGVNTPLTLTLTDTQTDATLLTTSATFIANDNFSLEVVNSAGAQTGDAVVTVGVY